MVSARKSNSFEQKTSIDKGFSRAFHELRVLESKIHEKEGFWIFKTHIYSKESLFNSRHYKKIYAYTENIGDIVVNWSNYGQLTRKGRELYNSKSQEIDSELKRVDEKISNRDPLWWESVQQFFGYFILEIQRNLPFIALGLLGTASELIPPLRYLTGLFRRQPQLPPQDIDSFIDYDDYD